MWEAISYVGTGLTLVAFLAAIVATVFKNRSLKQERLIKTVPENERAQLVRDALEFFHVDTAQLTKQQQYQVAIEQIKNRSNRHKVNSLLIMGITIVFALLSVFAIYKTSEINEQYSVNPFFSDMVNGRATSSSWANHTGSSVQLFEKGWMVADFANNNFYAISRTLPVKWSKIREGYVKGVDPNCDDPEGQNKLRLGFCWYYNLPESDEIREFLGSPLTSEVRAWVQFQHFDNDLLMYGIPTTKPGVESQTFQSLAAIYLQGEVSNQMGNGTYKLANDSTVTDKTHCSVIWYAARIDRQLPVQLRDLVTSGYCQTARGADEFTSLSDNIAVL